MTRGKTVKSWAMMTAACIALGAPLSGVILPVTSARADAPAAAPAGQVRYFRIAPQDLVAALNEFGRQSGRDILFSTEVAGKKRSAAVSGPMTAERALRTLLAGTGLSFRATSERTFLVELAQAETQPPSTGSDPAIDKSNDEGKKAAEDDRKVERVVVTGSHIRGKHPESSPLETFTRKDIERSGATTTEQFIQKLPQNLGTRSVYASGAIGEGVNPSSISSVDLRGLGVGTTLVLLNGRRLGLADVGRAVDISMIPASAIERVEVLTDGASAIYGSDAIGGVVNFVLRKDFDGAETRLSYGGVTDGGLRQGDFSQTFGHAWGSGNGLISYSAFSASGLEIADRPYANAGIERGALTPIDQRQNVLATFSQDFGDDFTVSGDLAFAWRDLKNEGGAFRTTPALDRQATNRYTETDQAFANLGLDYDFSPTLHGTFRATYAESDQEIDALSVFYNRTPQTTTVQPSRETRYSGLDLTAMVDGTLFALPGGDVRFSVGGGVFDEDYSGANQFGLGSVTGTLARRSTYAFAEVLLPIVGEDQNIPLLHRLELSLAARYTRYDDQSSPALDQEFGDGTDPKIGLLWSPTESLSFRGTYGTSFRAPSMVELDDTSSGVFLDNSTPIPFPGGPNATVIIISGRPAGDLRPEIATAYTLGFDVRPDPGFRVSGTYYNISYEDRIGTAPGLGSLAPFQTPELFPFLVYRPPSAAFLEDALRRANVVNNFLTPPPTLNLSDPAGAALALFNAQNPWVLDLTTRNLALSEQDGFDLSLSNSSDTDWGEIRYGANITRISSYRQQAVPGSQILSVVDIATQPVDLRGRVFVGLSWGGFDGTLNVNYVDDYRNNAAASGGAAPIASWTTADLNLSYDFGEEASGPLHNLRLSLSAQNIFDEDPPFVAGGTIQAVSNPVGFDPANANPLGRFVSLGLSKSW